MKHCPRCKQDREEAEFGRNRTRPDGLQVQCRACIKLIHHDWYERNKGRHYGNVQRRRKPFADEISRHLLAYLKAHPCIDCGITNPLVLEFCPPQGKRLAFAALLTAETTWDTILPELEKCSVRCANCRRIKSAKQYGARHALLIGLRIEEDDAQSSPPPSP